MVSSQRLGQRMYTGFFPTKKKKNEGRSNLSNKTDRYEPGGAIKKGKNCTAQTRFRKPPKAGNNKRDTRYIRGDIVTTEHRPRKRLQAKRARKAEGEEGLEVSGERGNLKKQEGIPGLLQGSSRQEEKKGEGYPRDSRQGTTSPRGTGKTGGKKRTFLEVQDTAEEIL